VGWYLNLSPTWSPDARTLAYTSYKDCVNGRGCRSGLPNIFLQHIFDGGAPEELTGGKEQNRLPVWSPDGTRIAFSSTRDGNDEIYVMNKDGSNVRRLTNNPAPDITPTWSPNGGQLAFTSDRWGGPAIYVMGADGLNPRRISTEGYCDRATWSPPPLNELAYV